MRYVIYRLTTDGPEYYTGCHYETPLFTPERAAARHFNSLAGAYAAINERIAKVNARRIIDVEEVPESAGHADATTTEN